MKHGKASHLSNGSGEMEEVKRKAYINETDRLQEEADMFTRLLEHERKDFLIQKDKLKNTNMQLDEINAKIKEKIPDERAVWQEKVARATLQHQLQIEKVLLNNTIGDNKELKVQIDIMRQEILSATLQVQTMEK